VHERTRTAARREALGALPKDVARRQEGSPVSPVLLRYLAREIFAASALVLVAFLGLFAFFDFINELEDVGKGGYTLYQALVYVGLTLPARVYELMPIAVLIGTLYALATLAKNSEITVMRASGMSNALLTSVLGLIGGVFAVLIFLVGEYVAPPAEAAAEEWKLTATQATVSQQLRSGLWVKDGRLVLNVRTLMPDRSMRGARIYALRASMPSMKTTRSNRSPKRRPACSTAAGSGSCSTCSVRASTAIAPRSSACPKSAGVRS